MKNTLYFALIIATMVGCSDDFLDLNPESQATSNNFYKNPDDINNAVYSAYAVLQDNGLYGQRWITGDLRSDNTDLTNPGGFDPITNIDEFTETPTNPIFETIWNDSYKGVNRCNVVLANLDNVEFTDQDLKRQYEGEVRFVRALIYFYLVRTYGDVPLTLMPVEDDLLSVDATQSRVSTAEVYAQIIEDLTTAATILPDAYSGIDLGRATSIAANGILGKVYLTLKEYENAETALRQVAANNVALEAYDGLFQDTINNDEFIFVVQYQSGGLDTGSPFSSQFLPQSFPGFVTILARNRPTEDIQQAYEVGDLRKDISLQTSYTDAGGELVEGAFVTKYLNSEGTLLNDGNDDWIVLRYADVYLMLAETLNSQDYTADGEAFELLNRVRQRAGLVALTATDLPDQGTFAAAVAKERRLELAFEGHRWFDLVRTDTAIEVMQEIGLTVSQDQLTFPIPQAAFDVNPNL